MIHAMMFSAQGGAIGQNSWLKGGTYSFVVPEGVYFIAAMLIGGGAGGGTGSPGDSYSAGAGGGGARAYHNAIPVTPGETLTIIVGEGGIAGGTMQGGGAGSTSQIKRGTVTLIFAGGGVGGRWDNGAGGAGGTASGGEVNQSGTAGEYGQSIYAKGGSAGGMGGYLTGANLYGGEGTMGVGGNGEKTSGLGNSGTGGGVRFMWGGGRSFPSDAGDRGVNVYRHWRIHIISGESGANNSIALVEVEWRSLPGGVPQTTRGTPVTASSYRAGYAPNLVLDGSDITRWESAVGVNANVTLTFDMGVAVSLVELALRTYSAGYSPTAFRIDASNDGTSFTTIRTYSPVSMPGGAWSVFAI